MDHRPWRGGHPVQRERRRTCEQVLQWLPRSRSSSFSALRLQLPPSSTRSTISYPTERSRRSASIPTWSTPGGSPPVPPRRGGSPTMERARPRSIVSTPSLLLLPRLTVPAPLRLSRFLVLQVRAHRQGWCVTAAPASS